MQSGSQLKSPCAKIEGLEPRRLLAASPLPLVGPAPKGLHVLSFSSSSANQLYSATQTFNRSIASAVAVVAADALAPFNLKLSALRSTLAAAPLETAANAERDALILPLPTPDGGVTRFKILEAPIMDPALAAQFPDIKTYRGVGIDDPTASIRLDVTPLGFHAQVLSTHGSYYIDPFFNDDAGGTYASYFKRDMTDRPAFECTVLDPVTGAPVAEKNSSDPLEAIFADAPPSDAEPAPTTFAGTLRTFRAAVAADGEYTAFHGGTVTAGQAAVVTAMNRVTGVYETELDIRLTLVANNSSLIYTNAGSDPYSNSGNDLGVNTGNINSVIGVNNYDIGHVFTTASGGVAYLGVVGNSSLKGGGTTGTSSPIGDAFYIDYVAHEMGHQFGANHTFNGTLGFLAGNENPDTAYEVESGSTIMAYAGIAGNDNLQAHSDPYFHAASIDEIRAFLGTIPSVGSSTSTGNGAPTVNAGLDYTIPTGTPFALTATGSDPNSDPLTYEWEEMDLGDQQPLTAGDNGASPLFRAYAPTTSPTRTVPELGTILAGQSNKAAPAGGGAVERLYTVSRTSNWRVIARDNKAGGGGVSTDDMVLNVVNTGAAFAVTSPNTAVSWAQNSIQTVTWNVAGTTTAAGNGINTDNVKISLSTDGGQTFPTVLAASTPNDGSQAITLPNINTTTARIKVEAVGNVFFDISNANFSIVAPSNSNLTGQVYEDRNFNSVFDSGEPTLNGVRIFLDTNINGVLDGGESFTDTAGSGNYSFASLPPATYHVRQILPATHIAVSPAGGAIDIPASGGTITQNFGDFPIVYTGTASADNYQLRMTSTAGSTPYSDTFSRATLGGGTFTYNGHITAGDGGASINANGRLELTNDATAAGNNNGIVYVTTPTSSFTGFNQVLSANAGVVTWSFNMRQIQSNPGGLFTGAYGVAYVLAASSDVFTTGSSTQGYAIIAGETGTPDPIKLVRFSNGLSSAASPPAGITTIQSNGTSIGTSFYSIKVTYDPASNLWSLSTRNDGASFADPLSGGAYNFVGGNVFDNTYTLSTAMTQVGPYWSYSTTAGRTAQFDNINLAIAGGGGPPTNAEVLVNNVVTYTAPVASLPSLAFNLGDGDDTLNVNLANGNPIPTGGVFYDGQVGANDALTITGTAQADAVTLASAFASPTAGAINLHNPATGAATVESITFNGGAGADTLALNAGSYNFPADQGATTPNLSITANPGAVVTFGASQHLTALSLTDATATLAAGGARIINTGTFSLTGAAELDFGDNDMIVRSGQLGSWNVNDYTDLTGLIRHGLNGGSWDGNGIITTQPQAQAFSSRATLGIAQALDVINFGANSTATWQTETVTPSAILIKYTYTGDSNLDGALIGDDYFNIDNGFPSGTGYFHGDFNYSGTVDADDYYWLDQSYASHGNPL